MPQKYWGSDEEYPVEDWRHEVAEDNTRQGYWEWVASQKEMNDENRPEQADGGDGRC